MMKFLRNGLLFAVTGLFVFTACDPAEDETPVGSAPNVSLSVETEQEAYVPGDVINLAVDFTADAPVVGATINVETSGSLFNLEEINGISNVDDENILDLNAFGVASETEGNFTIEGLIIPEQAAGLTLSFLLMIEDEEGRVGEGTLNIEVGEASVAINEFTAQLLGGPLNNDFGSFFNAVDGEVYTASEAFQESNTDKNDLVFWYGETSGYAIGAVDDSKAQEAFRKQTNEEILLENLNPKSLSRFKILIDDIDFAGIENESQLLNAFNGDGNSDETRVDNLAIGDVFGITLDEGRGSRIGLIEVEDIQGTTGAERAITINVKIQAEDN